MAALLPEQLRQRVRLDGSAPLFTFYDLESGARTELSATTFSNWVDKTSNLLVDEVAAGEGDAISMPLAVEAPGHWLTAVWQLACWQVGLVVDLTDRPQPAAVVTGRHWQGHAEREIFACALHPLGFGSVSRFRTAFATTRSRCEGMRTSTSVTCRRPTRLPGWTPSAP